METLEVINKRLLDNYGRGINDLPNYRVVWSSSQKEVIYGTFEKETTSGIYLGTETCEREVDKYPMYLDMWVLEHIQPNLNNPELRAKFSYEPIYIFKDKYDNALPLDWEVIEKIVYFHIHRVPPPTNRDLQSREEEKQKKEEAEFLDYLQHDKPFPNKMYDGAVVTVPPNYEKKVH
jgi:hypothetical protein